MIRRNLNIHFESLDLIFVCHTHLQNLYITKYYPTLTDLLSSESSDALKHVYKQLNAPSSRLQARVKPQREIVAFSGGKLGYLE